jgi:hypothetical protein
MKIKYRVRVTDPFGGVRIVDFGDVRFHSEDGRLIVIDVFSSKLKAVYPSSYAIEILDITNGNQSD